jgi:hypothetical protein
VPAKTPEVVPTAQVHRCQCGCGQILFATNPAGDAIIIRCNKGHNTELRAGLHIKPAAVRR